jgi:hypothetical protein
VKSVVTNSHRTVVVVVGGLNTLGKDEVPAKLSPGLEKAFQICISFGRKELAYNRMLLSIRITPRSGLTQIPSEVATLAPD